MTFTANTHNNKGQARDADAVPSYRIYEDETATPILTGNMALLDGSNTVGFYSERVQITAASGFEVGKNYSVYIEATVQGVQGTISHVFQIPTPASTFNYLTDGVILATGTYANITQDIWKELQSGYSIPGTFGYYLDRQVSIGSTVGDQQVFHGFRLFYIKILRRPQPFTYLFPQRLC